MVNIVLFDDQSVDRVAAKAMAYFSTNYNLRITEDTIWADGLYLRFYPKLITLNIYDPTLIKDDIYHSLNSILSDEEVFITDGKQKKIYIDSVNASTDFDSILKREVV